MKCYLLLLLATTLGVASAYPDYEKDGGGGGWAGGKPGAMGKDKGHDDGYTYKQHGPPPGYDYSPYPVTCVFEPEAQLQLHQCLMPGTAICRDGWAFGIDKKDGYVKLWKDDKVSESRLCHKQVHRAHSMQFGVRAHYFECLYWIII